MPAVVAIYSRLLKLSLLLVWPLTACCGQLLTDSALQAQDAEPTEQIEGPLIDQQPFDLITLKPSAGGASVRIVPLASRQLPSNPKDTDKLEVVLIRFPDREYEVAWRDIARIDLFEQRIYEEAVQKMAEKDFITAFQNLSYLRKNYPDMPRLEELRQEFLLKSAADRYQAGEYRQTLSALEELRATAPGYQAQTVTSVMSRVADALIESYSRAGDLGSAKAILARLEKQYGPSLTVVASWKQKLESMAMQKRDEAIALLQQKRYRDARRAAIEMLSILPGMKEASELIERVNREHPMVRVGVMQQSSELDPTSLINWPARRAGALVYRPLVQFLQTGTEGGRYGFALGPPPRLSEDRQQVLLSIDDNMSDTFSAFALSQVLLNRADPEHADYNPSWAAIFESVAATSKSKVVVQLRRPNVLPHALLQWIIPDTPQQVGTLPGKYRVESREENEISFAIREESKASGQPVEIIEVFYDDPKEAVNDLLRGNIDVLDQLYPADAKRLAIDPRLRIGSYALPTTHMLIPVSDHEYLANTKFRRALLYATNREAMLSGELLNSSDPDDGRLVSGPFPLGSGQSDLLAYAYNSDVKPAEYSPQLAKLLIVMTQQELDEKAKRLNQTRPEPKPLIVGCPDFEFARVAVQAMIQQWMNVGIAAEMLVLPPGEVFSEQCDLIYVTTTMWEPATDIERLLGGNGIAATDNPFIVQGLERLRTALNWRQVRTAMQDLHQLIDYHLPVLPLWQITDRFAVSRAVEGLEDNPVSLYQDIDFWRVDLGVSRTATGP